MNKNLDFYIKAYKLLDKKTCKKTIKDIEKINWSQHKFYNSVDHSHVNISGNKELDISYDECPTKQLIMESVWESFRRYCTELNFPWFGTWQGHSVVRFNRYKKTRMMAEHCDHIHSLFDGQRKGIPTMSALGLLNDDYEGGQLVFFGDTVVPLKSGEIMVFPSCFLFPHRIEPVTKGTRYSFVSWAW